MKVLRLPGRLYACRLAHGGTERAANENERCRPEQAIVDYFQMLIGVEKGKADSQAFKGGFLLFFFPADL